MDDPSADIPNMAFATSINRTSRPTPQALTNCPLGLVLAAAIYALQGAQLIDEHPARPEPPTSNRPHPSKEDGDDSEHSGESSDHEDAKPDDQGKGGADHDAEGSDRTGGGDQNEDKVKEEPKDEAKDDSAQSQHAISLEKQIEGPDTLLWFNDDHATHILVPKDSSASGKRKGYFVSRSDSVPHYETWRACADGSCPPQAGLTLRSAMQHQLTVLLTRCIGLERLRTCLRHRRNRQNCWEDSPKSVVVQCKLTPGC